MVTAGMAAPILLAGTGVGSAGAAINIGTSFAEAAINSTEIKKAEKDLKETLECINNIQNTVQLWLTRKEKARVLHICVLASQTLELGDPVFNLIHKMLLHFLDIPADVVEAACAGRIAVGTAAQAGAVQVVRQVGEQAAGDVAESSAKAGAKAGLNLADGLIIGVSLMFLGVNAVDLGFTIRDLIQKKAIRSSERFKKKGKQT